MRIHCPLTPLSILPIPACAIGLLASPHVAVAADNIEGKVETESLPWLIHVNPTFDTGRVLEKVREHRAQIS
jgi:hypothetical protein